MTRYVRVNGKWVRCIILKNGARLILTTDVRAA